MEVSKKLELVWPHVNGARCSAVLQRRYSHRVGIFMQLLWVIDFPLDISVSPHRAAISIKLFLETHTHAGTLSLSLSLIHTHTLYAGSLKASADIGDTPH